MRCWWTLRISLYLLVLVAPLASAAEAEIGPDPLPSWHAGATKRAILNFVSRTTTPGSSEFVPAAERIAVFDNDGTLCTEQPIATQFRFVMDRIALIAPHFPRWKNQQPFKAASEGDLAALTSQGPAGLLQLTMATFSGLPNDQFERAAAEWLMRAQHPRFKRRYTDLGYLPMLELLAYVREHGFKTWIVSGGGADFIRASAERIYGIPPEQVIGSSSKLKFEIVGGQPVLIRLPEVEFIANSDAKPVAIERRIGRRPIIAFGNSDGDLPMLQWTMGGSGPRLAALVHHTDSAREYAYDRTSKVGTLDRALTEAQRRGWLVVDMKADWKEIFAPVAR
jgi:phosphoserine phosphatase